MKSRSRDREADAKQRKSSKEPVTAAVVQKSKRGSDLKAGKPQRSSQSSQTRKPSSPIKKVEKTVANKGKIFTM
jgi:hypothetical protein